MKYITIDLDIYNWTTLETELGINAHGTEQWDNTDVQLYNDLIDWLGITAPKMKKIPKNPNKRKEQKLEYKTKKEAE